MKNSEKQYHIVIPALSIILLVLSCLKLSAQDSTKLVSVKSLNKIKAYLIGVGFEREQKITSLSTIYVGASIESVVPFLPKQDYGGSDILRIEYSVNFSPVFSIGFKNYYNLKRREKIGKTTKNNSSSFVGLEYNLIAPILINSRYTTSYVSSLSPIWGFQKNLSKNTNLEFSAGPSIQTDFNDTQDFNSTRASGFVKFGITFLL